jgi:hypothetical protein
VKIGLHIADFTYPSGPAGLANDLTRMVTAAEEAGFARISVMDHLWQIEVVAHLSTTCSRPTRRWATWLLAPRASSWSPG